MRIQKHNRGMLHQRGMPAVVGLALAVGLWTSGCSPATWMAADDPYLTDSASIGSQSVSPSGPSVGNLRHRDRVYDLREVISAGTTGSNDEFIRQFNKTHPTASLDARVQVDAVAVEDRILLSDVGDDFE